MLSSALRSRARFPAQRLPRGAEATLVPKWQARFGRTMLSALHGHNLSVVMADPYFGTGFNDATTAGSDILLQAELWAPAGRFYHCGICR